MRRNYTSKEKEMVVKRFLCGETVTAISKSTDISRSTIYAWTKKAYDDCNKKKNPVNIRDYKTLLQRCERQQRIISILKASRCTAIAPLHERFSVIEEMSNEYNVNTLCEALNVAKGSYYNHILRNKRGNTKASQRHKELKPIIEEIYNENKQIFGAGKITAILKERGYKICESTVAKIMHENGMFSIRTSSKTLYLQNQKRKENILNQEFNTTHPNEVWVSDVTYFKYKNKTLYICVIIDLFARKVVACRASHKNSTQLTKSTFKMAYELRQPDKDLLFHSDRGSNYISKTFMDYLKSLGVKQSFSRAHTPYDNSVCESFFGGMKREELYRTNYKSEKELQQSIKNYIDFYNTKRPHTLLRYRTPDKTEADFLSRQANKRKKEPDTNGSNT